MIYTCIIYDIYITEYIFIYYECTCFKLSDCRRFITGFSCFIFLLFFLRSCAKKLLFFFFFLKEQHWELFLICWLS